MFKSELLRAIQHEIMQHDFDCFMDDSTPGVRVVVPGCPKCQKRIHTMPQFLDHLAHDAMPRC
jgi:hypothetical protein